MHAYIHTCLQVSMFWGYVVSFYDDINAGGSDSSHGASGGASASWRSSAWEMPGKPSFDASFFIVKPHQKSEVIEI